MIRLKKELEKEGLTFGKLRNGQIAKIIDTDGKSDEHLGVIVQKYYNNLFMLGQGDGWSDYNTNANFRFKPLKNGTELIIEDNE